MRWWHRKQREEDLERELRSDLELESQEQRENGLSPEEARYAARRALGNVTMLKEEVREMWGWTYVETIWQDLRFGARQLHQSPGFTLTAMLTLALGIGANTAIFSLVNAVLLRSLPGVQSPDNLVLFSDGTEEGSFVANTPDTGRLSMYSYALYNRLRHQLSVFDDVAAQQSNTTGAVVERPASDSGSEAGPASARCVSANFFDVLGVPPLLGRTFRAEDQATPGANPVLVLSYRYWQRRFGADPALIGAQLIVNGFPYTVVGVTPPNFIGTKVGAATDFWVPLTMQEQFMRRESMLSPNDRTWWLLVIGRIKQDVPLSQAQAEVNVALQQFLAETPASPDDIARRQRVRAELSPGGKGVLSPRSQFGPSLLLLMGAVALLLVIACINVSHLLLARSVRRQSEVTLKLALGASRARVIRQLITEGLLLSALGGIAGLTFGRWCTAMLVRLASTGQVPLVVDTTPDVRVLVFSSLLILSTALLFGLVPVWQASRTQLSGSLKEASRGVSASAGGHTFSRLLLISQVALSVLLLVCAGLLSQTLRNLQKVDKGFREEHLLLVNLNSRLTGLNSRQMVPVYEQVLDDMSALPVRSASMASDSPLSGNTNTTDISIPGRASTPGEDMEVQVIVVTPSYFETMGMNILQGRGFSRQDRSTSPRVAVVNEAMARRFFDSGEVLGRHFQAGGQDQELTVAGVVKNPRMNDLRSEPRPTIFLPLAQSSGNLRGLQVRTDGDPAMVAAQIRQVIRRVNPNVAVNQIITLNEQVERSLVRERLIATLSGVFGVLALVLVCVGLYGVLSQSVAQRTAEIGLRVALGADQRWVRWLIFRESLVLLVAGIAAGIPASLAVAKGISGLLFALSPADPRSLIGATTAVVIVTLLASYIPAWRASRVDPMVALRH
jgi:predicted permease